ncbi:MAG: hypothetical protein BGO54_13325 [Sphingobacteriales bacterium 46-32]|nr:MAG: hypothetical protein BGO54_13325 [Sphingobacteriales bacterium 46-32]
MVKPFVLDGKISSEYYASLKEIRLDFISADKVEAKMTMYADALGYRVISDHKETESKIFSYSYESGLLSVPNFNLTSKLDFLGNGDIVTNENEYLYHTSIVDYLGTDEAFERLKQNSKGNFAALFKSFLEKPSKPLLRKEGGKLIFSDREQDKPQMSLRDSLISLYNDILVTLDSLTEIKNIDLEETSNLQKQIKQLLQNKNSNEDQLRRAEILIQELKKRINYFGNSQHIFEVKPLLFTGTKIFCDELQGWKYEVTIKNDSITLKLFPGSANDLYKNKSKSIEIIKGIFSNGKIVTKDLPEYLTNRFKYENGILYEVNNEGDYNDYSECK